MNRFPPVTAPVRRPAPAGGPVLPRLLFLLFLLLFLLPEMGGCAHKPLEVESVAGGTLATMRPVQEIEALLEPELLTSEEAQRAMRASQEVVGFVHDGQAYAVPLRTLDDHEIVNFSGDDGGVAATWCPLVGSAVVYDRSLGGREVTFLQSGKLWHDGLVMLDADDGTLWAQATGTVIRDPTPGADHGTASSDPASFGDDRLARIPSRITRWADWLAEHPDTRVVPPSGSRRGIKLRLYPKTHAVLGILGSDNPDPRLPGKTLVAGFVDGDDAVAVALTAGRRPQSAQVQVGTRSFVVEHAGGLGPTRVWASSGEPDWRREEEVAATTMYWFTWAARHPASRIVEAREVTDGPR